MVVFTGGYVRPFETGSCPLRLLIDRLVSKNFMCCGRATLDVASRDSE